MQLFLAIDSSARCWWSPAKPDQKLVPELQPLIRRISSADRTMLMAIEPRHPNRLEKKTNT
jgi:hypothetical protein